MATRLEDIMFKNYEVEFYAKGKSIIVDLKDFDGDKVSDWLECVTIAKSYGWEHGGDWVKFKDQPHFQKTFGKSIAELLVAPKFIQDNIEYPVI